MTAVANSPELLLSWCSQAFQQSKRVLSMTRYAELNRPFRGLQIRLAFITACVFLTPVVVAKEPNGATAPGKPVWAKRLDKPGLPNLHEITGTLYGVSGIESAFDLGHESGHRLVFSCGKAVWFLEYSETKRTDDTPTCAP